jgi:Phage integrase family
MQESGDMTAASQASFSVKRPPKKPTNAARRSREYLTPHEVEQVIAAARKVGRHPRRDAALILLMYRHGLRVAEAVSLRGGRRSTSKQAACMSTGSNMDTLLSTLYVGQNCGRCGRCTDPILIRPICLSRNGAGR